MINIDPEESLLSKGLNFIPTPPWQHKAQILQDFLIFERKICLHHYLYSHDLITEEEHDKSFHKILKTSTGWMPNLNNIDSKIETYENATLAEL